VTTRCGINICGRINTAIMAKRKKTSGPPRYTPKPRPVPPHPIDLAFAADPFDARFTTRGPGIEDRRLTPLGLLIQTYHYLRQRLVHECPDAVEFIEQTKPVR